MLRIFRALSATWPARLFFLVLAGSFVIWGVASKSPFGGAGGSGAATVGGRDIPMAELRQTYKQLLAQVTQRMGGKADLPPEVRRQVAMQSVEQLVTQASLQDAARRLGLAVPDAALLDTAHGFPAFRGRDGAYDPAKMQQVLQANGYTEQRFLDLLRHDVAQSQLLGAVSAGAAAPHALIAPLFVFANETRAADAVDFSFADAPAPPAPDEATLHRWYDNHPGRYTSPEYRRIRAAILDPATVEQDVPVSDEELHAAYEQRRAEFVQPERRSVQVLSLPDEATAQRLAAQWSTGADFDTIRKAAEAAGATATELSAATRAEFPAPELADAAFATGAETVSPPVKGALGWYVVRVTAINAGGAKGFDEVRGQLRDRIAADRASDLLDQRATQLDQDFSAGRTLDDQLAGSPLAETGTLDAQGLTPSGDKAPLRGTPALQAALVAAAFQAHKGDPLKLERVAPDTPRGLPSYYAVQVEDIIAPAVKPYDRVADAVRADWLADARRHEQDAAATKLLAAIQDGQGLATAATGLTVRRLPPVTRAGGVDAVPEKLGQALFTLHQGQATMVEADGRFTVAVLAEITDPDPNADPLGTKRLQDQLDRQIAGDLQSSYVAAARNRAKPEINRAAVASLVQAGG